jgi:HSP20 family protein
MVFSDAAVTAAHALQPAVATASGKPAARIQRAAVPPARRLPEVPFRMLVQRMATRHDPPDWMWLQACELIAQAERMHRQFFRLGAVADVPAVWEPPIDVFEDERELVVIVAMPGVAAQAVQVTHEGDVLVVRGTRAPPFEGVRMRLRQLEIPYGAFERRVALPPGRFELGPPELVQGCLLVRLRKER